MSYNVVFFTAGKWPKVWRIAYTVLSKIVVTASTRPLDEYGAVP
jgi:hypothetical protein